MGPHTGLACRPDGNGHAIEDPVAAPANPALDDRERVTRVDNLKNGVVRILRREE
jgi:hypothetical protein